jgi:hypothetical protein
LKGQTYYLKITNPSGLNKTFILPTPRRAGFALCVKDKTADTLILAADQTSIYPNVYYFVGQMKGKVYWMETQKTSGTAILKVPLADFPSGVAEFTAFDSLKNLLAKRLVFINENKQLNIDVKTDKQQYLPREKVTVTIQVTNEKGQPVEADLSLTASINGSKASSDNYDFFTYTTLRRDLIGYLPTPQWFFSGKQFSDKILDDLLIANGFKRFSWRTVLQVTESNPSFTSMENNGIPITNMDYDKEAAAYFARDISNSTQLPGRPFINYPANSIKRILNSEKPKAGFVKDYSTMKDVPEIVYSIKPYKIVDNQIVFLSGSLNSIGSQQGAAIAIDGVYRGTDPTLLNNLMPMDIDKVMVSTNPMDIQRYTGLNSIGIIEITTKSGSASKSDIETNIAKVDNNNLDKEFKGPNYEKAGNQKSGSDNRKTLLWNPDIHIDDSGKALVTFFNGDISSEVIVQVEGISLRDEDLTGSKTMKYRVK